MTRKGVAAAATLAVVFLSTPSESTACLEGQQPEPFRTCDESTEPVAGVRLPYGNHTAGCEINPTTDVDKFRFCGIVGERVRIIVTSSTACLDIGIEVRSPPSGALLAAASCSGGSPPSCNACVTGVFLNLPSTGCYEIAITDLGTDEIGGYTLQIERLPPTYCAPNLPYNSSVTDEVSPTTDQDFLTFEGLAGTRARVSVSSLTNCFDPLLSIIDPNGSIFFNDSSCDGGAPPSCGSCSFVSSEIVVTTSGTYTLLIQDDGAESEAGSYQISLTCLFGKCPLDPFARDLRFATKADFAWTNSDFNACYDIVKGDLNTLITNGGDFSTAVTGCLEPCTPLNSASDSSIPEQGAGFFYLVRPIGGEGYVGRYDNCWGPGQVCGRDPEINASPNSCP